MSRRPFVAGNWKMHKTASEAGVFVRELAGRLPAGVDVAVCAPFTALATSVDAAAGTPLRVFAQNMHQLPQGAFTGEISAPMLLDLGVDGVLLGHSERRQHYAETDAALAEKLSAALDAGLDVILAVGESEAEREAGQTESVLERQVTTGLAPAGDRVVTIAYEPIWAIGTGRTATPEHGRGGARLHPRPAPGCRPRGHADPVRRQHEAGERGGAARPAGHRRRPDRRRQPRRRAVPGDRRRGGMTSPVALVVLDGWGLAPPGPGNAVDLAETPVFDRIWAGWPHSTLEASGRAVGLPDGQQGNSEVGHLNLGAGRVVRQDLVRISDDVASGAFFENDVLVDACRRGRGSALHLVGLVSDGGVHSHIDHLLALIELARREGVEHLHVHAFTDGRDVSPTSGAEFLERVPDVATVCGRYYAMDRDRRWDRTKARVRRDRPRCRCARR